jgi:Ca-activated chloride channel family protein
MVGIGSAPNTFLMTRAAELGRGTFTHIGAVEQVEERMRALFAKIESPAVTNLTATFSATRGDATPAVIPDLYRGEPVALAVKVSGLSGTLQIKGTIGDQPWIVTLPLASAAEGKGLSKLWARRKITDAEIARTLRTITPDEADTRILALALDHHLMTRLTSLVAVEQTRSRPDGAQLTRADIPLNLPAGWEFDKVFGGERTVPTSLPDTRRADNGPVRLAQGDYAAVKTMRAARPSAAAPTVAQPAAQKSVMLPKTATDAELRLWFGMLLCLLSLLLLFVRRRRLFAH